MTKPEQGSCVEFEALSLELKKLIRSDSYPDQDRLLKKVQEFPPPWQIVSTDELKLTLTNSENNVFVKVYAPTCEVREQFVSKAHAALVELSGLEITYPILAPLARCDDALFFPLGEPKKTMFMSDLNPDERNQIKTIVRKHGLSPLSDHIGKLEIVQVGDIKYAVDPFGDTAAHIFK